MVSQICNWTVEDNIIKVSGIIDGPSAKALSKEIDTDSVTYLDFEQVDEIKFSGLRALLNCRKDGGTIRVINASNAVAERFEDTGVSSLINVCRKAKALDMSKYEEFGASFLSKAYNSADGDAMIKVYGKRVPKWMVAQEKAIAKAVMLFGIPTPLVGTIYEDKESTALDFERIEGKRSFSRIMFEEPDRLEEMSVRFARMCKKLHTTPCDTKIFAEKSIYYRRTIASCDVLTEEEKSKLRNFLDSVPAATTCLHGDMQLSNVITNGEEDMWIDLADFGYGNPMFDMGMWYFQAVYLDEEQTRHMYHFGKETMGRVWRIFIREYFGAQSEEAFREAERKVKSFGVLHMLYLGCTYGFEGKMLDDVRNGIAQL